MIARGRAAVLAVAAVMAVTALLVGVPTAAEAHDDLVGTSPADGSLTSAVPAQVTLTFSQPPLALGPVVVVTGPVGRVGTGAAVVVDNTVAEHLRPGSPAGVYTVVWRVSSADGHPVSGRFSFTARSPSPGKPATTTRSAAATPSTPEMPSTTAAPSSTAGTVSTAGTGGHPSTVWWVLAGAAAALLFLVGFLVTRKPRTTAQSSRDPMP